MASLIFRRDIENPHYKKNDAIVGTQSHRVTEPGSDVLYSGPGSNVGSPRVEYQKSIHDKTMKSHLQEHTISLPKINASSCNPSPRVSQKKATISISALYSPKVMTHIRNQSDVIPQISYRDLESPIVNSFRMRDSQPREESYNRKSIGIRDSVDKNYNFVKEHHEHNKLAEYLKFLDKTSPPMLKESFTNRINKRSSVDKIKVSIEEESYASPIGTINSLQSIAHTVMKQKAESRKPPKALNVSHAGKNLSTKSKSKSKSKSNIDSVKGALATISGTSQNDVSPTLTNNPANNKLKFITRSPKHSSSLKLYKNNYESLFKMLAQNLNEIYNMYNNEKKVHDILEKLAEKNYKLLEIISSKAHKIINYDVGRLEQRFAAVEVMYEVLSIPVKLEKLKQGAILVEPSLIKDIQTFNERLEALLIKKKREQLKLLGDSMVQSEENLKNICMKRLTDHRVHNKLQQFQNVKEIIDERPKLAYYHYAPEDPVSVVENHQHVHGDLKNIKLKNMEHARGLSEVVTSWRSHVE